jgi:hypothetical protein
MFILPECIGVMDIYREMEKPEKQRKERKTEERGVV